MVGMGGIVVVVADAKLGFGLGNPSAISAAEDDDDILWWKWKR
eukprot:CAMPEP_0203657086 /NCGR_PEP_ID=MMETSP0088-20131115/43565_1 /ASSEMBLY_ACC=CAM_ASM_001087 /TAXON_ID=426623 /ORGANISM="Chaetoceros affinis, Strain CCMP159" /LENGTH=42 /DNA_ID= /DNA_START= /DNA_END= /DNA_ORIENTATION=